MRLSFTLIRAAFVAALLASPVAHARSAMETNQLVDDNGAPIGVAANPLVVSFAAGAMGAVNQGTAASDIPANRWPVLAYQGGTWSVGLTGLLPAFAATPTFNLGTLNGAATATNQASEIAALGAPADAANANTIIGQLKQSNVNLLAPTPAGANVIGSVTLRSAGTNRSATVTTTASTLMASNANRQGWKIKNDCAVAVWINFDATAAASAGSGNIQVAAGAYLSSEPGFIETGAMSAIAASGTCALTVREH